MAAVRIVESARVEEKDPFLKSRLIVPEVPEAAFLFSRDSVPEVPTAVPEVPWGHPARIWAVVW